MSVWSGNRFLFLFLCCGFVQLASLSSAFCWDRPFDNGANWGGTGLMEIPTARVLEDGEVRFGYGQADPFHWYVGGVGAFSFLEVSGRYTEIDNIPSGLGSDFGAMKDKALDLKFQVLPECRKLPAVALGLHDFHGTELFNAQFIVFSRQIYPLDLTLGLGRGRLKGKLTCPFWDDVGFFGGMEWALFNDRIFLMAEYNPVEYETDPISARGVPEGARWPVNFGMRLKIVPGVNLGVSWQRGDTAGLMVHVQTKLGKPITPKRPDPPLWYDVDRRPYQERDPDKMTRRIAAAVREMGFGDVSVITDGKNLIAGFENNRFLFNQKAVGRVFRILFFYSPADTQKLTVIVKKRRIPILQVSVRPRYLEKYLFGEIGEDLFSKYLDVQIASESLQDDTGAWVKSEEKEKSIFHYGVKPSVETFFNDPSGVLKTRVGIKPHLEAGLWNGLSVYAQYDVPFYSNISSANEPLPDAVRSDAWLYLQRDYSFERLMVDQAVRLGARTFGRLSFGYLEKMYAGVGGEILTFLSDGGWALGLEADWVRKRKPGSSFDCLDLDAYTLLGNLYGRIPKLNLTIQAQYGRFLAGDIGWMIRAEREYSTGARFGFWYGNTDTDDLTGFNRGYRNKGLFLTLPARMFLNHDSTERYDYAISPWTRDVGAAVSHWRGLFHMCADLMPVEFRKQVRLLKD